MKLAGVVASLFALSSAVLSMEVIGDENREPFSFSNAAFSFGTSDMKKPINCQSHARRQVKKIITDYYPVLSVHEVSVDVAEVKRRRIESQPLSEIDRNIPGREPEVSEFKLRTRDRSDAIGSFEELESRMIALSLGK